MLREWQWTLAPRQVEFHYTSRPLLYWLPIVVFRSILTADCRERVGKVYAVDPAELEVARENVIHLKMRGEDAVPHISETIDLLVRRC